MKEREKAKIGVIGAGSWGTTLAIYLNELGHRVTLWMYEDDLFEAMARTRVNHLYLPDIKLSAAIKLTRSIEEAVRGSRYLLYVTPSHVFREVLTESKAYLQKDDQVLISASKGIENRTLMTMSQVAASVLGDIDIAVLSGPSFAKEVAMGLPTAVTIAAGEIDLAIRLQNAFSSERFRFYAHDDVIGTELGGAVKNVMAIATGISDGLGFGLNARGALITRGLTEMIKLGLKLGAKAVTFSGLSGLGDLVLTCTGDLSRNRTVGLRIGRGESVAEIAKSMRAVVEGIKTTKSVKNLADRHEIEMPITEQVYRVLYEGKDPRAAVTDLMTRSLKREFIFKASG